MCISCQEEELVGNVTNMENKYVELEKELNLERMHNAYLKATSSQYKKRAKQIKYVASASCEHNAELFHKCNRNIEVGLIFDGNI